MAQPIARLDLTTVLSGEKSSTNQNSNSFKIWATNNLEIIVCVIIIVIVIIFTSSKSLSNSNDSNLYKVKSGDTCENISISKCGNKNWKDNLVNSNCPNIKPGDKIKIKCKKEESTTHVQPESTNTKKPNMIIGGWCMNQNCNQVTNSNITNIYLGSFAPNSCNKGPNSIIQTNLDYIKNKYITFGGEGVGGSIPNYNEIISILDENNANGVDFDLEGCLHNKHEEVIEQAQIVKSNRPNLKIQLTCFGSSDFHTVGRWAENNTSKFDHIALMLYGDSMSGSGWDIPESTTAYSPSGNTFNYIKQWIDSSIPNEKIILCMTSIGITDNMIKFFHDLVIKHRFAGILFWNVNLPKAQESIDKLVINIEKGYTSNTLNPILKNKRFTVKYGDSCWKINKDLCGNKGTWRKNICNALEECTKFNVGKILLYKCGGCEN